MYERIIGRSVTHRQLIEQLIKIAPIDAEVLISGPTGVGKELYAHHIHEHSHRHNAQFVPINCGALPNDLFENELFGHIGGAFTGARPRSDGLVAEAEHGTLFLDEVDSLSLSCQVKLLRFLQEKEYRRLGETRVRRADVRIVAATNTNLCESVQHGTFRGDLFFRLRVFPIEVPPLCKRPEDILVLLTEYVAHYADDYGLPQLTFTEAALRRINLYTWPGNIRELENCVRYLTCLQLGRPVNPDDLPLLLDREQESPTRIEVTAEQPFHEAKALSANYVYKCDRTR
jgi:DNA-binding NtrC family response regulator